MKYIIQSIRDFFYHYKRNLKIEKALRWLEKNSKTQDAWTNQYNEGIYLTIPFKATIFKPLQTVMKCLEVMELDGCGRIEEISWKFTPYYPSQEENVIKIQKRQNEIVKKLAYEDYVLVDNDPIKEEYNILTETYYRLTTPDNYTITVTLKTWRPGIIIGKAGKTVDELKDLLSKYFGMNVEINIEELSEQKGNINILETIQY